MSAASASKATKGDTRVATSDYDNQGSKTTTMRGASTGDKDAYIQWAHGEYIVGTDNT